MLYSKNGSIPKSETDGTEGWLEVPAPPECPEGKEIVWLNWQWIVRDPKPVDREGYKWKWNQDAYQWIEYQLPQTVLPVEPLPAITSSDIIAIDSQQISAL